MKLTMRWAFLAAAGILLPAAVLAAEPANGEGQKIYDAKCASCHGKDAKGNPNMAKIFKVETSALDLTWEGSSGKEDAELKAVISKGKNKMPAYEKQIKPEQIDALLAYVRSLAPVKESAGGETAGPGEGAAAPVVSEAAKAQYAKSCASCHGKAGEGSPAMAKVFKVDPALLNMVDSDTLAKSDAELIKITQDGLNKMPGYQGKLSDDLIAEVIGYLRSMKAAE
ncbi:MAG: hypothetical protein A2636_04135 [Elusimicrobia bacterium RIFCSPHIGHO2_01_FULL_64_10]|nr:MAG: hypothetical protein A2636_04135 [Elusimicrobia bacterium RIFCSPHIGHO2_01_FULL_64_10]